MTTVRSLHERAMAKTDEMIVARQRGHHRIADGAALEAFRSELAAATLAFDRETSVATRVILLKSAANLAREAKVWAEGIDLAVRALAAEDLRGQRTQIFRIIDTLRTYEHLELEGIELADADVQLVVAGPDAAPGFARSDEVTRRVEHVRQLMVRTAMRRSGIPFEASTPRAQQFRNHFTPFLSQGRAASYAVTLRFGIGEQWDLGFTDDDAQHTKRKLPKVSRVLDDVIAAAQAYARGGLATLRHLIQDDNYAKNASTLLRQLSPDSERISTVGLTVYRRGQSTQVALPERAAFDLTAVPLLLRAGITEALPAPTIRVRGRLLEANALNPAKFHASVQRSDGFVQKFEYDEATIGDVIDSYWKHEVIVTLRRDEHQRFFLQSIDDA